MRSLLMESRHRRSLWRGNVLRAKGAPNSQLYIVHWLTPITLRLGHKNEQAHFCDSHLAIIVNCALKLRGNARS